MTRLKPKMGFALALCAAMLTSALAIADKPSDGRGKGKNSGKEHQEKSRSGQDDDRNGERHEGRRGEHFDDRHRTIVREYYYGEYQHGRCPPGLAKKHNGCRPPGQVRYWTIGRPLPREVIYYSVPPALIVQIGQPPSGYRYVRVASDLLLIALGTGMVVDAIQDLGGL